MSIARASSVFLSSYRNTVLNQSACVFALGYFLNAIVALHPLGNTIQYNTNFIDTP